MRSLLSFVRNKLVLLLRFMHCLANARQQQVRTTRVPCAEEEVKNEKLVLWAFIKSVNYWAVPQFGLCKYTSTRIWHLLGLTVIKSDPL